MMKNFLLIGILLIAGCSQSDDVYTLYRSGVGMPDLRIHVATFDSDDTKDPQFKNYNQSNYWRKPPRLARGCSLLF